MRKKNKCIVEEIRIKKMNNSTNLEWFQYELWGTMPNLKKCVFLGSNSNFYSSEPLAKEAGIKHVKEFPETYILKLK
jgi:hypothetical protein